MVSLTLKQILSKCRKKKVLLLTHEHADLDSFSSARMMQIFFNKNKIKSFIGVPSQANEQTKQFALKERISFVSKPNLVDYEIIILFDLNSPNQLGLLSNSFKKILSENKLEVIVFDHHEPIKGCISYNNSNCVINASASSTTQIVCDLLGEHNSPKTHFLNCLGLVEDTGHFLVGNQKTFFDFSVSLKKSGLIYENILSNTKKEFDNSQRIALLKAAQRSQITRINEVIVVTSVVSFYQSFVATKLLNFGAHISLVAGVDKKGFSTLSLRADSVFKNKNNFSLVKDLLVSLRDSIGGEIGGHSGAAQWRGSASPELVLKTSVGLLKSRFLKQK